jgi:hypothetical protein
VNLFRSAARQAGNRSRESARHKHLLRRELELLEQRITPTVTLNPPTLPADTVGVPYSQADVNAFTANQVISYVPGSLADASYNNPAAALGGLNPVTGDYAGTNYYLTPFDPSYSSSDLVEIGAGGSLELKLAQTASTSGATIGVHTGFGLEDVDYPAGMNSNPASYFNSWIRQADVQVSADGVNWGELGTITFDNPSNYFAGSTTDPEGLTPGVGPLANPGKPFLGSLSSFNGENWNQTLATLNGSAGGTWLELSGVTDENGAAITGVNYIKFLVPSNPPVDANTGIPELMMVDCVVGTSSDTGITAASDSGDVNLSLSSIQNAIPGLNVPTSGTNSLTITGTPMEAGTETFTVTATDSAMDSVSRTYTITVNPALALGNPVLPADSINAPYNQLIAASGGTGQIAYSIANIQNAIPGLTIASSSIGGADISGVPTAAGTETFTVTATDSLGVSTSQTDSITVNSSNSIAIHTPGLPAATVGNAYSLQLSASGGIGGYAYSATGLPAGLTLSVTGLLSGVPVATGNLPSTVTVTVLVDDAENHSGFRSYSLTVDSGLTVSPAALAVATAGDPIHTQLSASGGSGKGYRFRGVDLPSWLSLSSTGLLNGTPPATAGSAVDFSVAVSDSNGASGTAAYSLQIDPSLTISPTTLTVVTAGDPFRTQLTAAGGSGSGYTFAGINLPSWMKLSGDGVLSGTPAADSSPVRFSVRVTDSEGGATTRAYSLNVNPALTPTTTTLPVAAVGEQYDLQVKARGGSGGGYSFTASGLPQGLTMWSTGQLIGIPAEMTGLPSTVTATITVTDGNGDTGSRSYSLTVDQALTISPPSLDVATVGNAFHAQFTVLGGSGVGNQFVGLNLPSWLSLSKTGLLSGTPPATAGSAVNFSVEVTDSAHAAGVASYTLDINPALEISPNALGVVAVGNPFRTKLTAAGGSGSGYTFTASGMPLWLSITSNGVLSGTPPAISKAPIHFTVTVTDGTGARSSRAYALAIDSAPTIQPTTLPAATVNNGYAEQLTASGGSGRGYIFSSNDLPPWLTLSLTGFLSGTPVSAATADFSIEVADGNNATGTRIYHLSVDQGLSITPASLPVATAGSRYETQFSAAGGTGNGYTFQANGLPKCLTLASNGLLSGTPPDSAPSELRFSVTVMDSARGVFTTSYTLTIHPPLMIEANLPGAVIGTEYGDQLIASGGSGSGYTFTSNNLPSWLTLTSSGLLSGMPTGTTNTTLTFSVTVTDSDGATDTVELELPVEKATIH